MKRYHTDAASNKPWKPHPASRICVKLTRTSTTDTIHCGKRCCGKRLGLFEIYLTLFVRFLQPRSCHRLFPISSEEFAETIHSENKSFAGNAGIGTIWHEKPTLIYSQHQERFSYLCVHVQSSVYVSGEWIHSLNREWQWPHTGPSVLPLPWSWVDRFNNDYRSFVVLPSRPTSNSCCLPSAYVRVEQDAFLFCIHVQPTCMSAGESAFCVLQSQLRRSGLPVLCEWAQVCLVVITGWL